MPAEGGTVCAIRSDRNVFREGKSAAHQLVYIPGLNPTLTTYAAFFFGILRFDVLTRWMVSESVG